MIKMLKLRVAVNSIIKKNCCTGQLGLKRKCDYSQKTGPVDADGEPKQGESKRLAEFRKKLRETTDIDDLGDQPFMHPAQKDDPLPAWPNNTNPNTGEVGGPRGPEPTRYGDWERKGRVSDF